LHNTGTQLSQLASIVLQHGSITLQRASSIEACTSAAGQHNLAYLSATTICKKPRMQLTLISGRYQANFGHRSKSHFQRKVPIFMVHSTQCIPQSSSCNLAHLCVVDPYKVGVALTIG
jgi:hypothetical protein